jgi:hypothetical protein
MIRRIRASRAGWLLMYMSLTCAAAAGWRAELGAECGYPDTCWDVPTWHCYFVCGCEQNPYGEVVLCYVGPIPHCWIYKTAVQIRGYQDEPPPGFSCEWAMVCDLGYTGLCVLEA